jgi:hypothetical protein
MPGVSNHPRLPPEIGKRWLAALGDEYFGRVSVAADGTLWFSGGSGVGVGRISEPTR